MSGDLAGHPIRAISLSKKQSLNVHPVCFGWSSCWRIYLRDISYFWSTVLLTQYIGSTQQQYFQFSGSRKNCLVPLRTKKNDLFAISKSEPLLTACCFFGLRSLKLWLLNPLQTVSTHVFKLNFFLYTLYAITQFCSKTWRYILRPKATKPVFGPRVAILFKVCKTKPY